MVTPPPQAEPAPARSADDDSRPRLADALRPCGIAGCRKYPTYGLKGGKRLRCAQHRREGDVDVRSNRCVADGCVTYPSYGPKGGKRQRCARHRSEADVNVKRKWCGPRRAARRPGGGAKPRRSKRMRLCASEPASEPMGDAGPAGIEADIRAEGLAATVATALAAMPICMSCVAIVNSSPAPTASSRCGAPPAAAAR